MPGHGPLGTVDDVIAGAASLRAEPEREFHYVASDLLARNATRLRAGDRLAGGKLVLVR